MAEPAVENLQSDDPTGTQNSVQNSLAGFNAVVNPLLQIASIVANMYGTDRTNQTNRELVAATNKANADLWREQSFYNSPVEQMKRLKMAGINPSLMYGKNGMENMAGSPPQMQAPQNIPYPSIDPLTAAQVANLNAQTESITHATDREDQKQPITLDQLSQDLAKSRQETEKLMQDVKNLKMDEQIASLKYLADSVDYMFKSVTFNDSVAQIKLALKQSGIDLKQSEFNLDRAMKQLAFELVGWDLSNKYQRAAINLTTQEYNQNERLFHSIEDKYFWDAMNSWQRYHQTKADVGLKESQTNLNKADLPLKQLSFMIDARDNINAFENWQSVYGDMSTENLFGGKFPRWLMGFSDTYNHGIGLPLKFGGFRR